MSRKDDPRIVVIGGGTGSFMLLSALKYRSKNITALVNMADDGGSTGVLRDELGVLPPGDVRQCLVALANSQKMRDLFNYRFEEGGLAGHAFGNLFMAALEKTTGSFAAAVELASEVLRITGSVAPITLIDVQLCMEDVDGDTLQGEYEIAHTDFKGSHRPKLWLEPEAILNPAAKTALQAADMVVIAPGNLYGSLAPALLVKGLKEVIEKISAPIVYVSNLVTKPGQTDGFLVHDFVHEIERLVGVRCISTILYNTKTPQKEILETYAKDGEHGVGIDVERLKKDGYQVVGAPLVGPIFHPTAKFDLIDRTLLRHDSNKVAEKLMEIYSASKVWSQ